MVRKKKTSIEFIIITFFILFATFNIFNFYPNEISIESNRDLEKFDPSSDEKDRIELFSNNYHNFQKNTAIEYEYYSLLFIGATFISIFILIEIIVISGKIESKTVKTSKEDEDKEEDEINPRQYIMKKESLVLDFVQEYLDKNRYFETEKIISFINDRIAKADINLNGNGTKIIINSLLNKNFVVERSKLTKEDILLNSNRKKLFDFIKENPGIYLNKLVNKLGMSIFLVKWHLNMLLKFNFIRREKIENLEAYFDSSMESKNDEAIHILSREKCSDIIEYLKTKNEGTTKYQLSRELGMHPNTIKKYINKIEEFGLLSKKKLPNKILYFLNEDNFNKILNS